MTEVPQESNSFFYRNSRASIPSEEKKGVIDTDVSGIPDLILALCSSEKKSAETLENIKSMHDRWLSDAPKGNQVPELKSMLEESIRKYEDELMN
jgi:hypothetical protein